MSNRAAARVFVVVALATIGLGTSLPDLRRTWQPSGSFGFVTDSDSVVTAINLDSPADKAGIRVSDRIDLAATPPQYRFVVAYSGTSLPGQPVTFAVTRGSYTRNVTIVSDPEPMDAATRVLIFSRELALLLFVGLGAALVLLRPSVATWGFYFYCLGLNGAATFLAPLLFGGAWNWSIQCIEFGLEKAGYVGVVVFAAFFLHEHPAGWRAAVYRLALPAWLILCGLQIYVWVAYMWLGWPEKTPVNVLLLLEGGLIVVAMYAFIETYLLARGSARQRIRWVIAGFGVALVAYIVDSILNNGGFNPPYWLHASLLLTSVVVPLAVAYAVIKHRVIDVSFVVSRALVYGVLTTLLVGIFSLIDWFFTDYLRLARLGALAEVGAVVAFGLWFNGLHRRVDALIDATFFRQRHRAELQLARDAAALPLVTTRSAVAHFVVREPVDALSLASAALFRRGRDGIYTREEAEGWDAVSLSRLDDRDEPLLALAQAEVGPLSLFDHHWRSDGLPSGPARPVLALPIIVRHELAAIVFYGAHLHGEALDPDEVRAIAGLATGAAAAYDHLEADELRRENETLRSALAEAQIQPA